MITEERLLNFVKFVINDQYIIEKNSDVIANKSDFSRDSKDLLEFLENTKDNDAIIDTIFDWVTSHFNMTFFSSITDNRLYAIITDGLDICYMEYMGYDSSTIAHNYEKKYANADFVR